MEKTGWKITSLVFISLFLFTWAWIGFGIYLIEQEEEQTMTCYYDFCEEYPEADFIEGVCTCYEEDNLGDYIVAQQVWLG